MECRLDRRILRARYPLLERLCDAMPIMMAFQIHQTLL
jgi:hypothetical protein